MVVLLIGSWPMCSTNLDRQGAHGGGQTVRRVRLLPLLLICCHCSDSGGDQPPRVTPVPREQALATIRDWRRWLQISDGEREYIAARLRVGTEAMKLRATHSDGEPSEGPQSGGVVEFVSEQGNLRFVFVPGGSLRVGREPGQIEAPFDSAAREVTVGPMLMGRHEVSQDAWSTLVGTAAPSHFKGDDLPVESITPDMAVEFCALARARLPSQDEWEYVCELGLGVDVGRRQRDAIAALAWHAENAGRRTHRVGSRFPNAWGVFDMLGNVAEFCSAGPSKWVAVGGSWRTSIEDLRASNVETVPRERRSFDLGLRLVLDVTVE